MECPAALVGAADAHRMNCRTVFQACLAAIVVVAVPADDVGARPAGALADLRLHVEPGDTLRVHHNGLEPNHGRSYRGRMRMN